MISKWHKNQIKRTKAAEKKSSDHNVQQKPLKTRQCGNYEAVIGYRYIELDKCRIFG